MELRDLFGEKLARFLHALELLLEVHAHVRVADPFRDLLRETRTRGDVRDFDERRVADRIHFERSEHHVDHAVANLRLLFF